MATDFGTDISCYPDLDPFGSTLSGTIVLGQALARRLTTPRGGLSYDKNYGTDLRAYLNETITNEMLGRMKADIEVECRKDDRVDSCSADVTYVQSSRTIIAHIVCATAAGPFRLTVAVTQLTLTLLAVA